MTPIFNLSAVTNSVKLTNRMDNREPNTLFIGKVLYNLPQIDSTNAFAKQLLTKSNPTEGTLVISPVQTAGRGQIGSSWESQSHSNLTFSLILRPRFLNISQQFQLNMVIVLGIIETLKNSYPDLPLKAKWPNDIYVGNKKMGGILIENTLQGKQITNSVVGIGLNINQTEFSSNLPNPTSLSIECGLQVDLNACLNNVLEHIERRYLQLRGGKADQIKLDYLKFLYQFEEDHYYIEQNTKQRIMGRITDVDQNGQLVLYTNGLAKKFDFKSIRFL